MGFDLRLDSVSPSKETAESLRKMEDETLSSRVCEKTGNVQIPMRLTLVSCKDTIVSYYEQFSHRSQYPGRTAEAENESD